MLQLQHFTKKDKILYALYGTPKLFVGAHTVMCDEKNYLTA